MTRNLSRLFYVLAAVICLTSIATSQYAVKIEALAKDGPAIFFNVEDYR